MGVMLNLNRLPRCHLPQNMRGRGSLGYSAGKSTHLIILFAWCYCFAVCNVISFCTEREGGEERE